MINKILIWLLSSPLFWIITTITVVLICRVILVKVFSILSYFNDETEPK